MENTLNPLLIVEHYDGSSSFSNTGYTCNYFINELTPITVNYYDDYQFLELQAMSTHKTKLSYQGKEGYSKQYPSAQGLLTGTRTYLLDGSGQYTATAFYYDYRGNIIQQRSTNHLGGYDIVYNDLDFTGKPNKTLKEHNIAEHAVVSELYTYGYDHAGRLTQTKYKLNDREEVILADNTYDELGRLTGKTRHNGLDTEEYDYNIRNQPTKIQSGSFVQNLYYTSNPTNRSPGYYNGNLAHINWTYGNNVNYYSYFYDELNRLEEACFEDLDIGADKTEMFVYDKNGNIKQTARLRDNSPMDMLAIDHNGNQLKKITDLDADQGLYNVKEYRDLADENIEFYYDANGNLTTDLDRGIVTIRYNLLNLPELIQFKNGCQIKNTYNAAGRKLSTRTITLTPGMFNPLNPGQVIDGLDVNELDLVTVSGIEYLGDVEYQVSRYFDWDVTYEPKDAISLKRIYNPEGYVSGLYVSEKYTPAYHYYRRDHLGNVREVWRAEYQWAGTTKPAATIQRTQYYPSGLPWAEGGGAGVQQKKYNGKEWIEAHGLDEYDSEARWYYPAIMRTATMDPLAEKYYHISPYAWCGNNPVNYVDLHGDSITIVHRTGFLGLGGKETLTYESGNLYNVDGSAYSGKVKGYLKSVMGALGNLNATAEGVSLISELQNSTNMFTIKSGNNGFVPNSSTKAGANLSEVQAVTGNTVGSTGSGGTIYWNANSTSGGLDLTGSTSRPAYIGLGHEMGHASDSNQGLLHFSSDYTNALGATYFSTHNGLLKSEWRAVYRENLIRGQAGISLRTHYGYDITTGVPRPIGPRLLTSLNSPINYR